MVLAILKTRTFTDQRVDIFNPMILPYERHFLKETMGETAYERTTMKKELAKVALGKISPLTALKGFLQKKRKWMTEGKIRGDVMVHNRPLCLRNGTLPDILLLPLYDIPRLAQVFGLQVR